MGVIFLILVWYFLYTSKKSDLTFTYLLHFIVDAAWRTRTLVRTKCICTSPTPARIVFAFVFIFAPLCDVIVSVASRTCTSVPPFRVFASSSFTYAQLCTFVHVWSQKKKKQEIQNLENIIWTELKKYVTIFVNVY